MSNLKQIRLAVTDWLRADWHGDVEISNFFKYISKILQTRALLKA